MKKHLLWGAAVALVLSLSSCDDPNAVLNMVQEGILGRGEITITGQNGFYTNDTTLNFASTITDKFDTTVTVNGVDTVYISTLDIFANIDLSATGATLAFPFMGFQVSDTVTGTYTLSHVLTTERLRNFNFDSIADIVFTPSGFNVMVIAVSDTAWYITDGGSIVITEYPASGHNMIGTFNNVQAFYFTMSDVERLEDHLNDANLQLSDYFHPAVINGSFESRVYPSLIHRIIDEAYRQRGLWN